MAQPPPGSLGLPYLGETFAFLKDPFAFQLSRTKSHGNVWKTRILGSTVVFFAGPKAISFFLDPANFTREKASPPNLRELLHDDAVPFIDGDRHKTRKRLLLAAFTPAAIASYIPVVQKVAARFVARWAAAGEVRMNDELGQMAFDIANSLFADADPGVSDASGKDAFDVFIKGMFSPPVPLPFTAYGKALKARDRLRVKLRDAAATKRGGAIGVLKDARGPAGEKLGAEELEIELLHLYFAAHGGITAVLAWLMVVLAQNPAVEKRLREEVTSKGEAPDLDALVGMRYTAAVAREIRRVFPIAPATFFGKARKDLEVEGFAIREGWLAAGAIWPTLQDGATFKDPEAFRADRLDDAAVAALPANAYVPQGGGPREGHRCPAEALIDVMVPAFAQVLLSGHRLEVPTQDLGPGAGGLGPLPRDGLRARVVPRSDA